ncbi:hypothetical protein FKR81_40255 [Lentzea tibetensis]|uniref:AMIN-like domain-containing protein n=1 Tax=Lentzea tibetensis TaxID=2591470 RepID=A0A563EFX4_9PSEU|nr:hypothetical protein [Lentzea tibetensis]TWP44997.1 hypothetical protein FKR81_40255 [Lentzea tibetensis]
MKRLFVLLTVVCATLAVVPAASAAEPIADLTGIRTSRFATFDRVVLDLSGTKPNVDEFVTDEVTGCASGKPITVPGNQFLEVHAQPARGWNYSGSRKFSTPELANVRGIAISCDFEADLGIDIGYEKPGSAYTVSFIDDPMSVVIDIRH